MPCFRNFDVCSVCMGVGVVGLVVQVGNYVVGSCWRKVGVCGVVGVWRRIRMKVSRGSLFL